MSNIIIGIIIYTVMAFVALAIRLWRTYYCLGSSRNPNYNLFSEDLIGEYIFICIFWPVYFICIIIHDIIKYIVLGIIKLFEMIIDNR